MDVRSMHFKMIWCTIFFIYPSISSAFYLSSLFDDPDDDSIFFRDYSNVSNVFMMPTTTVKPTTPDIDDSCVGRLELLRFNTGPKDTNGNQKDLTVLKLNSFENSHWTGKSLLRMPLYKAFLAKSMVRIDSSTCTQTEIEFNGFTIMSRGTPPPLNRAFRSADYHIEKVRTLNGTLYEVCFGFITYMRILEEGSKQYPISTTVIKLHNEPVEHYTNVPHFRGLLLNAFFYNYEVQLLTSSCESVDYGFAAFKMIQPEGSN